MFQDLVEEIDIILINIYKGPNYGPFLIKNSQKIMVKKILKKIKKTY